MVDAEEATSGGWPSEPTDENGVRVLPPPPPQIGRYAVLRTIGAGGMGVVYAAYDEELDRRVAIKVLHPSLSEDTEQRARIFREAQAMAKVAHPNVAAIHEIGTVGRRLFVVMEFIDGPTLGAWQAATLRGEREILEVYLQAGRGLAGAHAARVVLRDFKPDNVMVDGDGRVRVLDFGLSRLYAAADDEASMSASGRALEMMVTRGGGAARDAGVHVAGAAHREAKRAAKGCSFP